MKQGKETRSERRKKLDKHHGSKTRKRFHKYVAIFGSAVVLSIPIYILYFAN